MVDATNLKKAGTGRSALGLIGLVVLIVAVIAVAAWALMQPGVLENVLIVVGLVLLAIVIIAIAVYAVIALSAIPLYAMKGEQYQENVDYSIEDIDPVEGKSLDDKDLK